MVVEVEATAYGMVLVEGGVEEGETQVGGQTCRVGSADAEGNALVGAGLHAVAEASLLISVDYFCSIEFNSKTAGIKSTNNDKYKNFKGKHEHKSKLNPALIEACAGV